MAALATGRREVFLLREMLPEVAGVIEKDSRPALVRITGELRVPLFKTGKLGGVAGLALRIRQALEVETATVVFLVAGCAGGSSVCA